MSSKTAGKTQRITDSRSINIDFARQRLLSWYVRHGRHGLPWRKTRNPYRVLVSEFMLQQTTVATTIPFYHRFLKRFPTLRRLAKAQQEQVLSAWSGLGYYARARHLHQTARTVLQEHNGRIPERLEDLQKLPGVGRYTAGAIRSLAFGKPAPILDGNVTRVLSRLLAMREDIRNPKAQERLWANAEAFADCRQARDTNLALFDLGATVCKPKEPFCAACPWQKICKARSLGIQELIPLKPAPARRRAVTWLVPIVQKEDLLLLGQRKPTGLFAGLWEFPAIEVEPQGRHPERSRRTINKKTLEEILKTWGLSIKVEKALPKVLHTLTHRDFTMKPFLCRWLSNEAKPGNHHSRFKWVRPHDIDRMAVSNLTRKLLLNIYNFLRRS